MKMTLLLAHQLIICNYIYSQTDTIQSNFGFSFSVSYDLLDRDYNARSNPYPYSQFLAFGVDPILNYKSLLYKNAFHATRIYPQIEIIYSYSKHSIHSMGIGYVFVARTDDYPYITDLASTGYFTNFALDYQLTLFLFNRKRLLVEPIFGMKISWNIKKLQDSIKFMKSPTATIIDKSSLLLLQCPLGGMILKNNFLIAISGQFNLLGLAYGKHIFSGDNSAFKNESINYSEFLLLDKFIASNYFFPNIQFRIGYLF